MPWSLAAIEDLDDVHTAAAGGTGSLSARRAFAGVGFGGCGRRQQIARSREVVRLGAAGEEPVVADAVSATPTFQTVSVNFKTLSKYPCGIDILPYGHFLTFQACSLNLTRKGSSKGR